MKILIIDDHAMMRAGIRLILGEIGDDVVFDEAGYGGDAMRMVRGNNYEVVLLDLSLPDMSGFEVLKEIKREKPRLPVVVVSMHDEEQYAIKAYSLGADGYVSKQSAPSDLVQAVEKVARGGKFVSGHLMDAVVSGLRNVNPSEPSLSKTKTLSKREKQIALLLVSGTTNKEIAWQLAISVKTVSTYKTRILGKLNLKNMAQLFMYAHVANHSNQSGINDLITSLVDVI